MKTFSDYIQEIFNFYRQNGLQIDPTPMVNCDYRENGALDPFIQTGSYNPQTNTITLYVKNRQLKDILRTFCHELVHHSQHISDPDGFMQINKSGKLQENDELSRIESDAYDRGNILFRKWTETFK